MIFIQMCTDFHTGCLSKVAMASTKSTYQIVAALSRELRSIHERCI